MGCRELETLGAASSPRCSNPPPSHPLVPGREEARLRSTYLCLSTARAATLGDTAPSSAKCLCLTQRFGGRGGNLSCWQTPREGRGAHRAPHEVSELAMRRPRAPGSGERAGSWRRPRRGKLQPQLRPCWLREHPCAREHPKLPQAGAGRDGGSVSIGNQPGELLPRLHAAGCGAARTIFISPAPGCALCSCKHPASTASFPAAKAGGSAGSCPPFSVGPAPRRGVV